MTKRTTVTLDDRDQGAIASVGNPDRAEWAVLVEAAAEKGITRKPVHPRQRSSAHSSTPEPTPCEGAPWNGDTPN
jgi:hypothetical protein